MPTLLKQASLIALLIGLAFVPLASRAAESLDPEAALIFDGQQEQLVIRLDNTDQPDGNFYKIVAVPGRPQISSAPSDFWPKIQNAATPKDYLGQLFGDVFRTLGGTGGTKAGAKLVTPGRIGDFEITALTAPTIADLQTQATAQGFGATGLNSPIVADYLAKNWYMVLIKPTRPGALPAQTIVVSFATRQPVYPWRLSVVQPNGQAASPDNVRQRQVILLGTPDKLQPDNSQLTVTSARQLGSGEGQDLVKGLADIRSESNFFLSTISSKISDNEIAQADLTIKTAGNHDEIGQPSLSLGQWPLAIIGTLLYGDIALVIVLWKLFSSDLIGIITAIGFALLIIAFLRPKRARPVTLLVLAVVHVIFVLAICLSVIGYNSGLAIVLISLLPGLVVLLWAALGLVRNIQRRDAETQRHAEVLE